MGCTPSKEQLLGKHVEVSNGQKPSTNKAGRLSSAGEELLLVATPASSSKELTLAANEPNNNAISHPTPEATSTTVASTENKSQLTPASDHSNSESNTAEPTVSSRPSETATSSPQNQPRQELNCTLEYAGRLSIILAQDDAGGHSREAAAEVLNNSYGSLSSSKDNKDGSRAKRGTEEPRRPRRRRNSHSSSTKRHPGKRRSKSPHSVSATDNKQRIIIPSNDHRLDSSGRGNPKKETSQANEISKKVLAKAIAEDAASITIADSKENDMDVSQLGASGSSLDFSNSASTLSPEMTDRDDDTHRHERRRRKRDGKKTKKRDRERATTKNDLNNLLAISETNDSPKSDSEKKSRRTGHAKHLTRQSSKGSVQSISSKQSASSRMSSSSKVSAGSGRSKTSKASSKRSSNKSKKKKASHPHMPENNPRIAPIKEDSVTAPSAAAVATQPPRPSPVVTSNEQTSFAPSHSQVSSNDKAAQSRSNPTTTTTTANEAISKMELRAKSLSGCRQAAGHSKLEGQSQHSLGAPSQHSLKNYLPEMMKASSDDKTPTAIFGGPSSRLSSNRNLPASSAHETLTELPETLDDSAEFAQEDNENVDGATSDHVSTDETDAGNQMPKPRSSIANMVRGLHLTKNKSHFEGGLALTDSDDGDESLGLDQDAIDKSYRKHKSGVMSKVLKQIKRKAHGKGAAASDGIDTDSERGSVLSGRESTGESVQSLDITGQSAGENQEVQAEDLVVFKFDASDTSIAQFDPTTAAQHSSCSELDRIHERRSIHDKRARAHLASTLKHGEGMTDLKESFHSSCSQIDQMKDPLSPRRRKTSSTKSRTKVSKRDSVKDHSVKDVSPIVTPMNTNSIKDGSSRAHPEKDSPTKDRSMKDASIKDKSMREVSIKGGSLKDGSTAKSRQRHKLNKTQGKGPITPSNPSRRASNRLAGESPLSGGSRRSSSGKERRRSLRSEHRDPPQVPRTLEDGVGAS